MPITHYSNYSMGNWMTEEEYNFLNTWEQVPKYKGEKWYRNKMRTLRTKDSHLNKSFIMYKQLKFSINHMHNRHIHEINSWMNENKKLQKQNKYLIFLVKKLRKK